MTAHAPSLRDAASAAAAADRVRGVLFIVAFFLVWLSLTPFPDLSDPELLEPAGDGNFLNQFAMILLSASLAAFVVLCDARIVLKTVTPLLGLTLAWFAVSAIFSDYPELAARRLLLAALTIFNAAAFLTLPRDNKHIARLLAVAVLATLAIAFASVVIIPERAIHQSSDLFSADLIGAWRGPFGHKNGAGAAMVIFIFIGIFISRSLNAALGILMIVLAGIFLFFTNAKAAMLLLPVVLSVSYALTKISSPTAKLALVIAIPLVIYLLTIGSVSSDTIHDGLAALLPDATFTDRDQIWRFTLDHIAQRPVFGFGFQAFWGTSELMLNTSPRDWVAHASHAHNGLLNLAVMTGITGAILSSLWIMGQTAIDYVRMPSRADDPMTILFVQIWLFGLCLSGFEATLFAGGNGIWFMMLVSMLGLRFQRLTASRRRS
jgi:O-antigen ligase